MTFAPACIIPGTVIDIDDKIEMFIDSLAGCNYVVFCSMFKFACDLNKQFSINDIDYIYDELLSSKLFLTEISLDKVYEGFHYIFGYSAMSETIDPKIILERTNKFWQIINSQIENPINKVFEVKHRTSHPWAIFYDFSYVFLSAKNGIYLDIYAVD